MTLVNTSTASVVVVIATPRALVAMLCMHKDIYIRSLQFIERVNTSAVSVSLPAAFEALLPPAAPAILVDLALTSEGMANPQSVWNAAEVPSFPEVAPLGPQTWPGLATVVKRRACRLEQRSLAQESGCWEAFCRARAQTKGSG